MDDNLIASCESVDELLKKREEMDKLIREGFFEITQARLAHGQSRYTGMLIPGEFNANLIVKNGEMIKSETKCFDNNLQQNKINDGIRKRKNNIKNNETLSETKVNDDDNNDIYARMAIDPLTWCGFAVSPHLKTAQKVFKDSLNHVVIVAAINKRIMQLTKL